MLIDFANLHPWEEFHGRKREIPGDFISARSRLIIHMVRNAIKHLGTNIQLKEAQERQM
jgi:hypothetical protein